jgi:hypothetical protein
MYNEKALELFLGIGFLYNQSNVNVKLGLFELDEACY